MRLLSVARVGHWSKVKASHAKQLAASIATTWFWPLGRLSRLRVDEYAERREDWFRVKKKRGGEGNVCSVLDYALLCRRGETLREGG